MFIRQVKAKGIVKKELEVGRSITVQSGTAEFDGEIDFISRCQGTTHIFLKINKNQRAVLKVYSTRVMIELFIYDEDKITSYGVTNVFVTSNRNKYLVDFRVYTTKDERYREIYEAEASGFKNIPVVVGDVFQKGSKEFTVIAITKNGGTMFLESESGDGLPVNLNDTSLIAAFGGQFTWGQPTK